MKSRSLSAWVLAAVAVVIPALSIAAGQTPQNWMQFRGPGALGVAEDVRLPDRWSQTENVTWVADIPGRGWSSPIVVGDLVVVTSVVASEPEEAARGGLYFGGERPVPTDPHRWVAIAADRGLYVTWEFEPGFCFNKPSEVVRVLDTVESRVERVRADVEGGLL